MKVIDLDKLVPENKKASLGGVEYALPGDMPLEIYLRINNAAGSDENTESDAVSSLLTATADLFAWLAPEDGKAAIREAVDQALRGRGVKFLMEVVRAIYGEDANEPEAEATEDPTEPQETPGTPSMSTPEATTPPAS